LSDPSDLTDSHAVGDGAIGGENKAGVRLVPVLPNRMSGSSGGFEQSYARDIRNNRCLIYGFGAHRS